jgi:hypothetical protein
MASTLWSETMPLYRHNMLYVQFDGADDNKWKSLKLRRLLVLMLEIGRPLLKKGCRW